MKLMKLALVVSVLQGLALPVMAQNREDSDSIFQEPLVVQGSQIFLGLTELAGAIKVLPSLSKEQAMLQSAQAKLTAAKEIPVSETERRKAIALIVNNQDNYIKDFQLKRILAPVYQQRVFEIQDSHIYTPAAKQAVIQAAQMELVHAQETALKAAQNIGLVDKGLRILRKGTALILVGDVIGRVAVWDATNPKNTWSPIADYVQNQAK